MRYLTLPEVLELYHQIMAKSGGKAGIRDLDALESALAQPRLTFEGRELYPTLAEKAAALGYALIRNHPFLDGNKRIGHAAMEVFLVLNGFEISADIDEQEDVVLKVASGELSREVLATWLQEHLVPISR
ncbi:type II toxin-antitoxin system death-on-curing family toxin [Rhodothermus marinus]|uniref:type II toxin-antitoxin system death-on-curing family toxin n=1 Tax=Rhodothermus marinus TaxID=29549 RepID=UPI0037C87285